MDLPKTELDIDGTISSTCNQGGYLKLEFQQPRKNSVKLMLIFDSGGSMYPYSELCNQLFQAVNKANHFKDVKLSTFTIVFTQSYTKHLSVLRENGLTQLMLLITMTRITRL